MIRNQLSFIILFSLLGLGCANQTQPTGGPRDEDPPILVSSQPSNEAINFNGQTLSLEFNELIKEDKLQSQLIITPSIKGKYKSRINRNRLVLTFEEPFLDSTTYTFNFRESIKDVTENNPAENLILVFSTGSFLDSLSISGKATLLMTNEPARDFTVAVYSSSDTIDLFDAPPLYATQSNEDGEYSLLNLRSDNYRIYAWKDKNNDLLCQSENEPYSFLNEVIALDSSVSGIHLKPYFLNIKPLTILASRQAGQYYEIRFSKRTNSYSLRSLNLADSLIHHYIDGMKTIRIYNTLSPQSLYNFSLTAIDSAGHIVQDTIEFTFVESVRPPEPFNASISEAAIKSPTSKFSAIVQFDKPIRSFNDSLWSITIDSVSIQLSTFNPTWNWSQDSLRLNIQALLPDTISKTKNLSLSFPFNAFQSIESDTSTRMTKPIAILNPDNFGAIELEFQPESNPFVVQLTNPKGIVQRQYAGKPKLSLQYLNAAEYKIRILIDENEDGIWSPGNINRGLMPEPVQFFFDDEAATDLITLKKNWVLGPFIIQLNVNK